MSFAQYLSSFAGRLTSAGKVPQAALADNVAGNGPAFSAYQSTLQSLPNGAWAKLNIHLEIFDTASAFNNTSGTVGTAPAYSFNPQVPGYYVINASLNCAASSAGVVGIAVYKNGVLAGKAFAPNNVNGVLPLGCALVFLNGSTDYVDVYGYQNSGGALNGLADQFHGYLARSA
jgi:hypothetical protein